MNINPHICDGGKGTGSLHHQMMICANMLIVFLVSFSMSIKKYTFFAF